MQIGIEGPRKLIAKLKLYKAMCICDKNKTKQKSWSQFAILVPHSRYIFSFFTYHSSSLESCPMFPPIKNGRLSNNATYARAEVTVSCDPNYKLVGASSYTCGGQGEWKYFHEPPECIGEY